METRKVCSAEEKVFVLPNHNSKLMRDITSLFDNKNVVLSCHILSGHFQVCSKYSLVREERCTCLFLFMLEKVHICKFF